MRQGQTQQDVRCFCMQRPEKMVRPAGIEPAAYSLGGYRSIQLSYERIASLVDALEGSVKKACFLLS